MAPAPKMQRPEGIALPPSLIETTLTAVAKAGPWACVFFCFGCWVAFEIDRALPVMLSVVKELSEGQRQLREALADHDRRTAAAIEVIHENNVTIKQAFNQETGVPAQHQQMTDQLRANGDTQKEMTTILRKIEENQQRKLSDKGASNGTQTDDTIAGAWLVIPEVK